MERYFNIIGSYFKSLKKKDVIPFEENLIPKKETARKTEDIIKPLIDEEVIFPKGELFLLFVIMLCI